LPRRLWCSRQLSRRFRQRQSIPPLPPPPPLSRLRCAVTGASAEHWRRSRHTSGLGTAQKSPESSPTSHGACDFAWRAAGRAWGTDGRKRCASARFPSREPDSRARHPSRTEGYWSLPRLPSGAATEDAIALHATLFSLTLVEIAERKMGVERGSRVTPVPVRWIIQGLPRRAGTGGLPISRATFGQRYSP
jgi:hypothetical protein